jgi:general secretion pathway protein L
MALDTTRLHLFGLDLSQGGTYLRSGFAQALRWPALAWLTPSQAVRVFESDGRTRFLCAYTGAPRAESEAPRFEALRVDEAYVLLKTLTFPDLPETALEAALALEVGHASPFTEEDTLWGWRIAGMNEEANQIEVDLAIVQARHVQGLLEARPNAPLCECWVLEKPGAPIVLRGFGEHRRLSALRKQRRLRLLAVAGVLFLALLLLVSPFFQLRAQVFEAQTELAHLQARSGAAVQAREALQKARDQASTVQRLVEERPDLPTLLETLSRLLPDHTHIIRMDVEGTFVRLTGQGNEASLLVEQLSAQPAFRNLRSPSPIVRVGNTGAERFSLEFHYVPQAVPQTEAGA